MLDFDPRHAEALTLQADELLKSARVMPAPPPPPPRVVTNPPHPRFVFTRENVRGDIEFFHSVQDGDGTENGRFWTVGDSRIGWDGEAYQKIKRMASKLASGKPLGEFISTKFALDETFAWLRSALEKGPDRSLAQHLRARCEEKLFRGEVWVPLERTFANRPFSIGTVTFRAIHKNMMDVWYSRINPESRPEVKAAIDSERSSLQALLAACTTVCAEPQKAFEVALERANDAAALLRFLSEANWSCRARTSTAPMGIRKKETISLLFVTDGAIHQIVHTSMNATPRPWNVTENINLLPNVLPQLHDLASNSEKSELRKSLYESLLIYSRNSLTTDLSEKLLFVLVALESLLLRDGTEAIQGNLAERLAFLAGPTLEERKAIVEATRAIYKLRSNFVHHGKAVEEVEALERFLSYAWNALAVVLANVDGFSTRGDLISYLNDRRLA